MIPFEAGKPASSYLLLLPTLLVLDYPASIPDDDFTDREYTAALSYSASDEQGGLGC
jgi:hypothetical protein